MKTLIFEYCGWCEIPAEDVEFQYVGSEERDKYVINGEEWLKLSQEDQDDYCLGDYVEIIKNATDGEWIDTRIEEENDD